MTEAKTEAHVTLHVLVRGVTCKEGETIALAGRTALVTLVWAGIAATSPQWPGVTIVRGDAETIIWCEADEVSSVTAALGRDPRVLAVSSSRTADMEPPPQT